MSKKTGGLSVLAGEQWISGRAFNGFAVVKGLIKGFL
jgi:hypothetical protein